MVPAYIHYKEFTGVKTGACITVVLYHYAYWTVTVYSISAFSVNPFRTFAHMSPSAALFDFFTKNKTERSCNEDFRSEIEAEKCRRNC